MKTYFILLVVVIFSSCSAERRMSRIAYNHEYAAASVCARFFPIKDSIVYKIDTFTITKTIPGTTITIDCDSVIDAIKKNNKNGVDTKKNNSATVKVPCPPSEVKELVRVEHKYIYAENTALTSKLKAEISDLNKQKEKLKETNKKLWWVAGIFFLGNVIQLLLKYIF